jgi:mono/diheme cytochrome c family protein
MSASREEAMKLATTLGAALALGATSILAASAHDASRPGHGAGPRSEPRAPVRITHEELHRHGGVPPGWRFSIPPGDARKGREVFVRLECFKCHTVRGEQFPAVTREPSDVGPELAGMGSHHPREYLAESILNPNAVIVTGPGHTGPDGLSIMPDFRDSLTAGELVDLVAYLESLTDSGRHDHEVRPPAEQTVGDYRVRVEYHAAHRSPGGSRHGKAAPAGPGGPVPGHLMVFVSDAKSGEPVPYLPVTVTLHRGGQDRTTVRLAPMVGARGFHYGADVALPVDTTRIVVQIGRTTMRVMPSAGERFRSPTSVTFEWRP